ncbi:MAG TPA: glycosyltransferase [Gemmatirosa sp.]|nr:glycosyltransferase [Gemmatirosa sp.]
MSEGVRSGERPPMRVLMAHSRYQQRGGEDESTDMEVALLRDRGHDVAELFADNRTIVGRPGLRALRDTVWSPGAYAATRRLIGERRPDVVHVQNFFPLLSPSVYYAARAQGVPVVQTLRNYRLLCPNALFFRDGRVCEDCRERSVPWPGVAHACYRGSRPASAAVAAMLTVHNAAGTWKRAVDLYVALSEFARGKFVESGLPPDRIVVKPNFVHPDPGPGPDDAGSRRHALFIGRLSVEKGVHTLLSAWSLARPGIVLKIVGDGPLADEARAAYKGVANVEWLGRRSLSETYALLGEAAFLVFPSEWYETFGRVAMEAFAKGTPVIAARIGAVAELVDHGVSGLHFTPGDAADLAARIDELLGSPARAREMGRNARAQFERKYTAAANYERLVAVYARATAIGGGDAGGRPSGAAR